MQKVIFSLATVLFFLASSCNQHRCACTDAYVRDVKHASRKVASQTCESIEKDRQILKKSTKCDLQ